jgi:hypothetical protein
MSVRLIDIALAGLNVERGLRDALIGDLIEARTDVATASGERSANRWLRREILRSLPVLAYGALREGGTRLLVTIVCAAVAALALIMGLVGASAVVLGELTSPETVRRFAVIALTVDLAYGVVGGYLAARFGRSAPLASAFAFGLLGVPITMASTGGTEQSWYPIALQLLLVPATLCGGWLRARRLARQNAAPENGAETR